MCKCTPCIRIPYCGKPGCGQTNETNRYLVRPSVILKPRVFLDGDQYCALHGENLMEGVCGFGDTPELAMCDFDKNWYTENVVAT